MKALRFYLDHGHWELALDLVRDYCDNSQLHFKLFYCLIDRMNKVRKHFMGRFTFSYWGGGGGVGAKSESLMQSLGVGAF